jgi:hypothetical protein
MARGQGNVVVNIVGKVAGLRSALADAEGDLGKFGSKIDDTGKKFEGWKGIAKGVGGAIAGLGLGAMLKDATGAAVEDEAAQAKLAKTLKNTIGATQGVVAGVEKELGAFMKVSTFTDDQLRPAYETLIRSSKSTVSAHDDLSLAMDIAAAKGISLETAANALAKAQGGNLGALNRLVPGLVDLKDKTITVEDAFAKMRNVVGGSAAAALDTSAGRSQKLKRDLGELQETIGAKLLPVIAKLTEWLQKIVDWFTNLSPGVQTAILVVAGLAAGFFAISSVIGAVTSAFAVFGVTLTVSLGPVLAVVAAIAAVIAIGVLVVKNWDTIKAAASAVWAWVRDRFGDLVGFFTGLPGKIAGVARHMFDPVLAGARAIMNAVINIFERGLNLATTPFRTGAGIINFFSSKVGVDIPDFMRKPINLPSLHAGGTVPGVPGTDVLAMLQAGERVLPRGATNGGAGTSGGGGTTVVQLVLDGRTLTELVFDGLLEKQRRTGALGLT